MPKYRIRVLRNVVMSADIDVEAVDREAAEDLVLNCAMSGESDVEWCESKSGKICTIIAVTENPK